MRRGTRAGEAYVAIAADGSGINEEIVDSVDEAGPGVEKAGKEHGKKYGKGFGKQLDSALDRFSERISAEFGRRMEEQADRFGGSFEKAMKKASKRLSDNLGKSLGESLRDSMDSTLEQFGRMIDTMESRLGSVSGNGGGGGGDQPKPSTNAFPLPKFDDRRWAEALRMDGQFNERLEKSRTAFVAKFLAKREQMFAQSAVAIDRTETQLVKDQEKLYDRLAKEAEKNQRLREKMEEMNASLAAKFTLARERMQEKSNQAVLASDVQLVRDQRKLYDRLAKEAVRRDAEMWKVRNTSAKAHYKYLMDLERGVTDERGNRVRKGDDGGDKSIGATVGGLFGAGSRNNALNLMGRTIGGIASLTERAAKFAQGFGQGFAQAAEGASIVQKMASAFKGGGAASGLSKAFSGIAASGPAALAVIVAIVVAMSGLVSVAGALLGIVTALAAAITSGLVAAAIVAGGAFAALAVAGGLLTAAFMSMTDAQKTLLSDAFKPLHEEMVGLGQLMITQMIPYFDTWSANLQQALVLLIPLASQLGMTFGQAGDIITSSLSGPGFQRLADSLGTWLPSIILRLTNAFGEFLNGVAGSFAAVMPFVDRFAGYLERVATRWSAFTNSDTGQNAIVDFVDRGLDSLQSLWNFVREFSGFIFDVLFDPASQKAGQTIFDGMADAFAGFRQSISSGDLERWFNDAIEFGTVLWDVMQALGGTFLALYNSGVLDGIGASLGVMAGSIELLNFLLGPLIEAIGFGMVNSLVAVVDPLQAATNTILAMGEAVEWVGGLINKITPGNAFGNGAEWDNLNNSMFGGGGKSGGGKNIISSAFDNMTSGVKDYEKPWMSSADWLQGIGNDALNQTSKENGGYMEKPEWVNPYVAWAQSLIDNGPSDLAKVKVALRKSNRLFADALREVNAEALETLRKVNENASKAIREAVQADSAASVQSTLANLVDSMLSQTASSVEQILSSARSSATSLRNSADSTVQAAQSSLNSAASSLASASTPEAAVRALAEVQRAQVALAAAEAAAAKMDAKADRLVKRARRRAERMQKRVDRAQRILDRQQVLSTTNVAALVGGLGAANATLADYAEARSQVADKLADANQKLSEAIQLRDDFRNQITESIKSFGALTTAQAKVIDGVEQSLTALDITSNLEDRLGKIRKFQENLRLLLAMGLNDSAYKQLLSAGVDQGGAFAEALLAGGQGAVGQTNALTDQIDAVADALGLESSNRLYQAGVDAAQGLVDGLNSLSAELDAAATRLGETIAQAVANALGIASPSKVLDDMMDPVGDGAVNGLDRQGAKVGAAARRFSDNIAVSPEVAAWATRQGEAPTVSGNGGEGPKLLWTGDIVTPTEDPEAVVHEVINEIVGRL